MEKKFLQRAIELAKESIETGGGPFGAVIVKNGEIVDRFVGAGNKATLQAKFDANL